MTNVTILDALPQLTNESGTYHMIQVNDDTGLLIIETLYDNSLCINYKLFTYYLSKLNDIGSYLIKLKGNKLIFNRIIRTPSLLHSYMRIKIKMAYCETTIFSDAVSTEYIIQKMHRKLSYNRINKL